LQLLSELNGGLCCQTIEVVMTDFNWCHGPKCHEKHTVDRVRGVKGSKVLRTRKVKITNWNNGNWYSYFCSQQCYDNFANKHIQQVIAIAPRTECLETPINDPKRTTNTYTYGMNDEYSYNRTETKIEVDETRQS
jgi:YHS domain-containing protein